ncbi:MAG: leucyl/phenylalanyl-tRNA--protein transferase [Desulfobacterota bacterium]|nr:leucyl/phenylalanyl-tRNA--protein transferase [Thermodesulfobacteriota bacterium]
MPIYRLARELIFPDPEDADPSGLLAVGGDLSLRRLLLAYSMGIFPWYTDGEPILWWSPDPRLILEPASLNISKSLARTIRKKKFVVTLDRCFEQVIRKCASIPRRHEQGTWIIPDIITAYLRLHHAGFAHSVETWEQGALVGGLYGVSLGAVFFGESMFSERPDASKTALVYLVHMLDAWGIRLIDCQVRTEHLVRMGAREIPRTEFLRRLREALRHPTRRGRWSFPDKVITTAEAPRCTS